MSAEIDYYDEEVAEILREIGADVDRLKTLKGSKKQELVDALQGKLDRAKRVYNSFEVELRALDEGKKAKYKQKLNKYKEELKNYRNEVQWAKTNEGTRDDLLGPDRDRKRNNPNKMNAKQLGERALEIQDESLASIDRSLRKLEETEQVGTAAAAKLHDQTNQLVEIQEDLRKLESNVDRSKREITAFMRRMATDKLIVFLVALVILALLIAVVVKIVFDLILPHVQKKK
eukprot:GEZU01022454.1.p1 GENE.GEZU01022454.1~~GEZU01022454.1.p1  ORF type:complete len:231 (+),score=92.74 GEZU01022454.1:162-854(+)